VDIALWHFSGDHRDFRRDSSNPTRREVTSEHQFLSNSNRTAAPSSYDASRDAHDVTSHLADINRTYTGAISTYATTIASSKTSGETADQADAAVK
jgi:hypothetical protein